MNEIDLYEEYEEIEGLIARMLDALTQKGNTKQDLQVIQKRCNWIIALMSLFPEMRKYEDFLVSLKKINEQGPNLEITRFVHHTVRKFFNLIFTAYVRKPTN